MMSICKFCAYYIKISNLIELLSLIDNMKMAEINTSEYMPNSKAT